LVEGEPDAAGLNEWRDKTVRPIRGRSREHRQSMQERLQKIIARAGIASRRHAEQLILSGQVRVNGRVVTELGTKADAATDRIEAAGRVVKGQERRVYLVLNKPPEIVSAMADPEGRKTLKNCLRGFPERVYPVGNLEYTASGLVFLTNDGDLAAAMLRHWGQLEQVYFVKVKGMLTLEELERLGKEIGVRMKTVRQPDATRRRAANYWYEVRMRDTKKEEMRNVLFREGHPVEKMKRVGLGPLTVEGVAEGRYKILREGEVVEVRKRMQEKKERRKEKTREKI
jgi:23S rRNA pseudouridine2605 synthase